jgi:creatinine amidohydrolase/Fe(II)-dependent formamide hydrolase-like protein
VPGCCHLYFLSCPGYQNRSRGKETGLLCCYSERSINRTGTGAMGQPQLATAAKGEQLLAVAADAVAAFAAEFRGWKPGVSLRR